MYREDQNGDISGYAEYDKDGCMATRFCTSQDGHGVEGDAHMHTYQQNPNPKTGEVHVGKDKGVAPYAPTPEQRPYK